MEQEKKLQILDITVAMVLFIIACFAGKLVKVHVANTWWAFNGPALGVFGLGELIWWRVRKKLVKKK